MSTQNVSFITPLSSCPLRRAASPFFRAHPTPISPRRPRSSTPLCSASPSSDDASTPSSSNKRRRKRTAMSAETRAKISAALKGRAKSSQHREKLRRRFGGEHNPMYGRKLSPESRAKISKALAARKQRVLEQEEQRREEEAREEEERAERGEVREGEGEKKEDEGRVRLTEDMVGKLREAALESRLLGNKGGRRKRIVHGDVNLYDDVLQRVRDLDAPPEGVAKAVLNTKRGNQKKKQLQERNASCEQCDGAGMVVCRNCVGKLGVRSARCDTCFGAGSMFCEACDGIGLLLNSLKETESGD